MTLSPLLKKIITGLVITGLVYGGYAYFFKKSTTNTAFTTVTTTVKRGNIENSVQVIGVSALVYEQKMQFSQGGKVAKIFFKEGDKVKKWQVMAELDTTDVLNDIKQQQVSLDNASLRLAQTVKGPTDKDLLSAENSVTSAESKITTLENSRENIVRDRANKQNDFANQIISKQSDIRSNEDSIKSAESKLLNAQNELVTLQKTQSKGLSDTSTDVTKTLDTALVDARKQIIDADTSLYDADVILGISDANRTKNDAFEMYLAAKNSALKTQTELDWAKANTLLGEAKSLLNTLPIASDATSTTNLLKKLSILEDALIMLGKDGTDTMNASITASNFSQTTIDGYANTFGAITSASQSSLSAINNTIATINKLTDPSLQQASNSDAISAKKQSIADQISALNKLSVDTAGQLQRDLIKLQSDRDYSAQTYDAQLTSNDLDTKNAKDALKYSQESLRLLKAGATKEDIALARNSIASQKISLDKVREGIKKYQLEAPFDGVLRKVDFKLGDNIVTSSSATPLYLYIENPNLVEITATVDQLDVVKLKLGQEAKIVFDPFPTLTLTGKVSDINSTPAVTSGVTSYTIKITMDKGDHPIFSGMTAKVDVIIESRQDTLVVSTSFIQKGRGQSSVLKRVNGVDTRTDVTLGISNPSNTEILSWVSEGDAIVRRVATSTGSSSSSLIQLPSGGGNRASGGGNAGGGNFNRGQ